MGMYLRQDNQRTKLQERVDAELREKLRKKAADEGKADRPDGVDDSKYVEGTKQTTSLAWVWGLIFLATAGVMIWLVAISL